LHTYISKLKFFYSEIQSTPVLHIDISDETKQDALVLNTQLEELKMTNHNQSKKIAHLDNEVKMLIDENNFHKSENVRLTDDMMNKDKMLGAISHDFSEKEHQYRERIAELEKKLEYTSQNFQNLLEKYEKVETELTENSSVVSYVVTF
jgi:hypothetical protein